MSSSPWIAASRSDSTLAKHAIAVVAMHPLPVIAFNISLPPKVLAIFFPSDIRSTFPLIAATHPYLFATFFAISQAFEKSPSALSTPFIFAPLPQFYRSLHSFP
jgi:hypothetical protein